MAPFADPGLHPFPTKSTVGQPFQSPPNGAFATPERHPSTSTASSPRSRHSSQPSFATAVTAAEHQRHHPALTGGQAAFSPHSRTNSAASSSLYTDVTSMSEGDGSPGGRKPSTAAGMKRARSGAGPYTLRQAASSSSDVSTGSPGSRRSSVSSHHDDEEELADFLRRGSSGAGQLSREGSTHSHWSDGHFPTTAAPAAPTGPMHVDPVTGMILPAPGAPGFGMEQYGGMPHQAGMSGPFPLGSAAPPPGFPPGSGMMQDAGLGGMASLHVGGYPHSGMMSMTGPLGPGMMHGGPPPRMAALAPAATMGGAAAQLGRMSLDSSETYEALAHHIRTAHTTSAADRARQAFVQAWLNTSYMAYTDGNVSRQGLYGSYLRICNQYDIKPINAASFGKAVRQCFPSIKTRRLGVRGNSKYHYCGIRPANQQEAEILATLSRSEKPEGGPGERSSAETEEDDSDVGEQSLSLPASHLDLHAPRSSVGLADGEPMPPTPRTARPGMPGMAQSQQAGAFEDRNLRTMALPSLEEALQAAGPAATTSLDGVAARSFWAAFAEHSKSLLDVVRHLRFDQFELNLRTFWTNMDPTAREAALHPVLTGLIYRSDAIVYDEILDYLHGQTLNPLPPSAFTALRQLAHSMEQVIIVALESFPGTFVGPKIELAARFGHLIIRHLGICQLSQALANIFSTPSALHDMVSAWDGIDFEAVRNQAALVTSCQHDVLSDCFERFRAAIAHPHANIESFIAFVEQTYERCLMPTPDGERGPSPRSLLVRWSYVSSQLLRDLTLRSATTFGSFQIVNLFFDEWLGFKVLRKVALHVAAVPVIDPAGATAGGAAAAAAVPGHVAPGNAGFLSVDVYGANNSMDTTMPFIFSPNTAAAFAAAQEAHQRDDRPAHAKREDAGDSQVGGGGAGISSSATRSSTSPSNEFSDLMDVSAFGAAMNEHASPAPSASA